MNIYLLVFLKDNAVSQTSTHGQRLGEVTMPSYHLVYGSKHSFKCTFKVTALPLTVTVLTLEVPYKTCHRHFLSENFAHFNLFICTLLPTWCITFTSD